MTAPTDRDLETCSHGHIRVTCSACRNPNLRLVKAVDHALAAFWASVAADYPEITTGDLDPHLASTLEFAAADAVAKWVRFNG